MAHTPGPWRADFFPEGIGGIWNVYDRDGKSLHNQAHNDRPMVYRTEAGKVVTVTPEEIEANARLIAAAPDLLAACEGLLPHCSSTPAADQRPWIVAAYSAISKAKGA